MHVGRPDLLGPAQDVYQGHIPSGRGRPVLHRLPVSGHGRCKLLRIEKVQGQPSVRHAGMRLHQPCSLVYRAIGRVLRNISLNLRKT